MSGRLGILFKQTLTNKNKNTLDNHINNLMWVHRRGIIDNKNKKVFVYEDSKLVKEYISIKETVRDLNISYYILRKHLKSKDKIFVTKLNKIVIFSHTSNKKY